MDLIKRNMHMLNNFSPQQINNITYVTQAKFHSKYQEIGTIGSRYTQAHNMWTEVR